MTQVESFVGIDVSKRELEVAIYPSGGFKVANDGGGIACLIQRLGRLSPALVVLEPTGGYEKPVLAALLAAGLKARRVDAWRVRRYAEALGRRAKTDPIDAAVLARFAHDVAKDEPQVQEHADARLVALVDARAQLVQEQIRLGNQLAQADDELVHSLIQARLDLIEAQLRAVEAALEARVAESAELKSRLELLRSAPGVGPVTAFTLLARLSELGARDAKRIAALVGVAPADPELGALAQPSRVAAPTSGAPSTWPRWAPAQPTPHGTPSARRSPPRATRPRSASSPSCESCSSLSTPWPDQAKPSEQPEKHSCSPRFALRPG
ncbi:MAG TPA: transposase [Caulobacteraceae bacterium]